MFFMCLFMGVLSLWTNLQPADWTVEVNLDNLQVLLYNTDCLVLFKYTETAYILKCRSHIS